VQNKGLARIMKESQQERGTHILLIAEGRTFQDSKRASADERHLHPIKHRERERNKSEQQKKARK
jgi:hypothetical protein